MAPKRRANCGAPTGLRDLAVDLAYARRSQSSVGISRMELPGAEKLLI